MAKGNNIVDLRLAEELKGPEKLKALILARYGTLVRFASRGELWATRVSQELSGARRDPEVRRRFAALLELPVEEVDRLIDEPMPQAGG